MQAKYAAAIFDLDGTLVALPVDWAAARRELSARVGLEPTGPLFEQLDVMVRSDPDLRSYSFNVLDRYESAAVPKARILDGVREILESLEGLTLGLVTMQGKPACDQILNMFGLHERFKMALTREDSLGRTSQLLSAVTSLSSTAERTFFVGDRLHDAEAGKKAQVTTFLVGPRTAGRSGGAPHFNSLDELSSFLIKGRL